MSSSQALNELDAVELRKRIAQREVTAEAVAQACLDRIEARDGDVRAWTTWSRDLALKRARQLDAGPIMGPLHGLPLGVKDLFDTVDWKTGYGSPIYQDHHRPIIDAAAVTLCLEAGAVPLGKTVTTEFATFEPGPTRNPHDTRHTPGGSSSGSAAAVADGMVPLAFGSQTAASIIRPAAYCGVVGFKPTFGRVSRAGVKSLAETLDTVGGFGQSVDAVALLGSVLIGDPAMADLKSPASLKVGIFLPPEWDEALPETRAAVELAVSRLSRQGIRVEQAQVPALCQGLGEAHKDVMAFEAARALATEYFRHRDQLSGPLRQLIEHGRAISAATYMAAREARQRALAAMEENWLQFDVMLAPSATGEAPLFESGTGDPVFCRMWSLLGLPCVHLPFARGPNGLPVGLQVVGRQGADADLLAAAKSVHAILRDE